MGFYFGKGKKLRQAAADGDKSKVLRLVAGGTDVNAGDNDGNTPLHLASLNGHMAVAEALLANGANVNAETEDGDKNKNVLQHIAGGANVNAKYNDGTTPLHLASREGHAAVAEALLANGAEANAGDNCGWRPLHWTGKNGHAAVAEVLLAHGATVDAKENGGNTPLHSAGAYDHAAVAEVLLADGADVNAKNNRGYTPLHGAGEFGYAATTAAVAEVLLANGADVNAKSNDGTTPLYWATSNGDVAVAEALLVKGAGVNTRDTYGVTPLHKASIDGHAAMVEVLLAKGGDANAKDKYGRTPREFAASHGQLEVIRILENALASPNDFDNKNVNGDTAKAGATTGQFPPSRPRPGDGGEPSKDPNKKLLQASRNGGTPEVLKLIAAGGASVNAKGNYGSTPLHWASENGHAAVAEALLAEGADVNAMDNDENTPLHLASFNGHAALVEVLLDKGGDVNAKGNIGNTPLHLAVLKSHAALAEVLFAYGADISAKSVYAVAKALLAKGADVNAGNNDGNTPLHLASFNGHATMVEALIAKGADVGSNICMPPHLAVLKGHAPLTAVLLANGANIDAKNVYGKTPRDVAAHYGHAHAVRMMDNVPASPNAFDNENVSSDTAKLGATTGNFPPLRRSPGGDGGALSPDSDGAGEIPDRGLTPGEPPARNDASPSSRGGARGGERSCAELTEKDFAFLEMGRELVRDGTNKLPAISGEERTALRDLTANMVDIERSLESVQELPSSLSNLGPEVAKYFSFFTSAFERAYVAAQALSSGAVKVQLNLSLEAFFDGTGWVAENCGLPFVGFVSIFSAMMAHQQSAKKTKAFVAFEEFFRGNSRDQYFLTYRKLGEQFSLQLDVSSLDRSDPGKTSKLKKRVKSNIVAPIRKYLRKIHLDAIQQLSPIEEKAMADLASLTKEVLRLHKDERHTYHKLRASNEYDKASYFVGHIFGKPLESVHPTQNPMDGTSARNTSHSNGDTAATLQRMSEEVKSLKKITDANANAFSANSDMAQEFKQVKAQVRKLAAELNGQKDVTVPSGCQVQVQLNPDKPKEDHVHQRAGHPFNLAQMEQDIHQLQILHEKQSRDVEKMKLEHFINSRVLSYHEAFKLSGTIISMVRTSSGGKIELSDHGKFDYDGKNYRIGVVCKGGMFSKKRTLWKGKVEIKLETEHRGVKSVMDWFDETELRPLYERNKKEAVRVVFAEELELEPCLADMVQPYRYRDAEGDREKLGI